MVTGCEVFYPNSTDNIFIKTDGSEEGGGEARERGGLILNYIDFNVHSLFLVHAFHCCSFGSRDVLSVECYSFIYLFLYCKCIVLLFKLVGINGIHYQNCGGFLCVLQGESNTSLCVCVKDAYGTRNLTRGGRGSKGAFSPCTDL